MPAWPPTTIRTVPGEQPAPPSPDGVIDVTADNVGDRQQVADIREHIRKRQHLQPRSRAPRPYDDGPEAA